MTPQAQSQILGLLLAILTAAGCVAYERLVRVYSFGVVVALSLLFYLPALTACCWAQGPQLRSDLRRMWVDHPWASAIYLLTWLTAPIWYVITKRQGVLAGGIYEMKYLVVLAVGYALFGGRGLNVNIVIGLVLALTSVWFVSRG